MKIKQDFNFDLKLVIEIVCRSSIGRSFPHSTLHLKGLSQYDGRGSYQRFVWEEIILHALCTLMMIMTHNFWKGKAIIYYWCYRSHQNHLHESDSNVIINWNTKFMPLFPAPNHCSTSPCWLVNFIWSCLCAPGDTNWACTHASNAQMHRMHKWIECTNASNTQMHRMHKIIECTNASNAQMHRMHKCVECAHASNAQMHRMHTCVECTNASNAQMHRMHKFIECTNASNA